MATQTTATAQSSRKEELLRYLNSLWTKQDLMKVFNRGHLTIQYWYQREGMPVVRIPGVKRDSVRFDRDEILAWAKKRQKQIFWRGRKAKEG